MESITDEEAREYRRIWKSVVAAVRESIPSIALAEQIANDVMEAIGREG